MALVLYVLAFSCSSKLEFALNLAGNNRAELESVIEHYSDCPQKRNAAIKESFDSSMTTTTTVITRESTDKYQASSTYGRLLDIN